jgi:hypothetical protein
MTLSEFEIKRCEKALDAFLKKRRPPSHMRNQLDFGYEIDDQDVILSEIRPNWRNPDEVNHQPLAKASYIKSKQHWKIYWMRQTLKWGAYEPVPTVKSIEDFVKVVDEDANCFFFG